MKNLLIYSLLALFSFSAFANTNLSDAIDKNEIPAEAEPREEEVINHPDPIDRNDTPAVLEDRRQEEEWREDYDQEETDTQQEQVQ